MALPGLRCLRFGGIHNYLYRFQVTLKLTYIQQLMHIFVLLLWCNKDDYYSSLVSQSAQVQEIHYTVKRPFEGSNASRFIQLLSQKPKKLLPWVICIRGHIVVLLINFFAVVVVFLLFLFSFLVASLSLKFPHYC